MAFAYSAGVITQTGTDTILAGLSGLTGVTVTSIGSGLTSEMNIYTLSAGELIRDVDA